MTAADGFIARWKDSGGAELANSQSFLKELCTLLGVPQPEPAQSDDSLNIYVFEKAIEFNNGDGTVSPGRVDLYRRACFVLESKQGSERKDAEQAALALATATRQRRFRTGTAERGTPAWEQAMVKARQQARRYAEALPEWPPFLIVVDVGSCFDLYADFSGTGKHYVPFPDPQNYRLRLEQLADAEVYERLRAIWLDPFSLDPSRRAARVTRDLAARLAELAKRLEARVDGVGSKAHSPQDVAQFLMRCLFTMFAEDVELIGMRPMVGDRKKPEGKFTALLKTLRDDTQNFVPMIEGLWRTMNAGGFSQVLREQVRQFNGGLFEDCSALPVNRDEIELLIEAAEAQWRDVEPAIFGTLLERALDAQERHKLGAHFTPRAYVERLVIPTLIEPLRKEWDDAYAVAALLHAEGRAADAVATVRRFHERLCQIRVLDPACGSGNFLYVALELMKRLEGEVLNALREFGERQLVLPEATIDPHQFLGIEVNPRAAAITDLVLWIGYLQWHFRTRGNQFPAEPIIRKFHNIECRDAVLAWDSIEPVVDDRGQPVTRWDGRTTKPHPVTGEEVPDESARVRELRYVNPHKAEWPPADYIIGNPPYIGARRIRSSLGDPYVESLRTANPDVPETADLVMYWWHKAAQSVGRGESQRFGFITTNSIVQSYSRLVLDQHLTSDKPIAIRFAIADHPWVDAADGAAVRVAMTVGVNATSASGPCQLGHVLGESEANCVVEYTIVPRIGSRLTDEASNEAVVPLRANDRMCYQGIVPAGDGFKLTTNDLESLGFDELRLPGVIRRYIIGRDLVQRPQTRLIIDFFGFSAEQARQQFPSLYQWLYDRVWPERQHNNRAAYRDKWWIFAEPRPALREALVGLKRFIATPYTAKFRPFIFTDAMTLPDAMAYAVVSDDAFVLGILSSAVHRTWALNSGGTLEDRPRYNSKNTFLPFPFPESDAATRKRICELALQLDSHRKRQQELHADLTVTGMYNVLAKLRAGEALSRSEQVIHEQGLISVLRQIHDDLDAAVFDAYGWQHDLSDEQMLERLVALNHERAAEEERGLIRWLRPEFQNAGTPRPAPTLDLTDDGAEVIKTKATKPKKAPWPASLPERIRVVRDSLYQFARPATSDEVASRFIRAQKSTVAELLDTLVAVGQARRTTDSRYAP